MKYKSVSYCVCEVVLGNTNFEKTVSASAEASASSTGIQPSETIERSNRLASTQAYNKAFERAMAIFNLQDGNKEEDIFLKDETSKLTNDCYAYIYTNPANVVCNKPFTLNYISPNININHIFNLTFNEKIISTFIPNTILTAIPSDSSTSYLSNVTINRNTGECFVSANTALNAIYTVNKTTGEYEEYLDGASGLQEPVGVEFDVFNNMFVANFLGGSITVYDSSKTLIYTITNSLFQSLGGLGFYKGILYALNGVPVTNDQYDEAFIMFKIMLIYDSKNVITGHDVSVFCTNTLESPLFMCFDNFDNCYVTNYYNDTISKINMTNAEAVVYIDSSQGLLGPRGIVIDEELNLFVSCGNVTTATYFVSTINKNKNLSTYTTTNLNSPRGMAIDVDGDKSLYICNGMSALGKIMRDKYLFNVEDNILGPSNNELVIQDATDNTIIDTVFINNNC